jgi:hypothetical protein
MKKAIFGIVTVIVLGLLFWGGSVASNNSIVQGQHSAAVASALSAPETFFDFGAISMKDGKVRRLFTLKNAGEQAVTVKKLTTSCMCTEAFAVNGDRRAGPFSMPGHGFVPPANEIVPAGGTLGIDVVFDPAAHGPAVIGRIERAIFIEDEAGGVQTLTIRAMVTP